MKKITILLAILLLTAPNNTVFAKKSKKSGISSNKGRVTNNKNEEKKTQKATIQEWSERKKQMDPLQLKDLVEENHRLKTQNRELEEKLLVYKQESENTIKLQAELQGLKAALHSKKELDGKLQDQVEVDEDGYEDVDDYMLRQDLVETQEEKKSSNQKGSNTQQGRQKKDEKSTQGLVFKVQVGAYDDYWKADKVKKELRAQGKKTWIVVFKNGKQVPLKLVLEKVIREAPQTKK